MGTSALVSATLVYLLLTLGSCGVSEDREVHKLYLDTIKKYENSFDKSFQLLGSSADKKHFASFKKIKLLVDSINSDVSLPYTSELNMFSLMTDDEKELWTGLNVTNAVSRTRIHSGSAISFQVSDAPASVDYSKKAQPPIKSQGRCGSCWAFGAISAIEFSYYATTGDLVNFAEQELLDCCYGSRDGCRGGWYDAPFDYVIETNRLSSGADYTYKAAKAPSCGGSQHPNRMTDARLTRWDQYSGDDQLLQTAAKGVVAVAVQVVNSFEVYKSGIYKESGCNSGTVNHALNVVGYGSRDGRNFWRVRNSWGEVWADKGHILMCRDQTNLCQISSNIFAVASECTGNCNPPDFEEDDGNDSRDDEKDDSRDDEYDDNDYNDKDKDDADDDHTKDWKAIERMESLPIHLGDTPLEIRTCEKAGNKVKLHLLDSNKNLAGALMIKLQGTSATISGFGFKKSYVINDLSSSKTKIWKISRCKSGLTKIKCDDKLVLAINPDTFVGCRAKRYVWRKMDVNYLILPECDTATKAYRCCEGNDDFEEDDGNDNWDDEKDDSGDDEYDDNDYNDDKDDADDDNAKNWKDVTRMESLPIHLDETPVEIKTCERAGSISAFYFLDSKQELAGALQIELRGSSATIKGFACKKCHKINGLSSSKTKVWQISRSNGITNIKCDDKLVLSLDPDKCVWCRAKRSLWKKKDVKSLIIIERDTATKAYRSSDAQDDNEEDDGNDRRDNEKDNSWDDDNDYNDDKDDADDDHANDWKSIEKMASLPIHLGDTPLEIKTCESDGNKAKFYLLDSKKDNAGALQIDLRGTSATIKGFAFKKCHKINGLSSSKTKVWQISRSKEGITQIKCDGKLVLTFDPDECVWCQAKSYVWKKKDVNYLMVLNCDHATKGYRSRGIKYDFPFHDLLEKDSGEVNDIFSFLADPSDANKNRINSLLGEKKWTLKDLEKLENNGDSEEIFSFYKDSSDAKKKWTFKDLDNLENEVESQKKKKWTLKELEKLENNGDSEDIFSFYKDSSAAKKKWTLKDLENLENEDLQITEEEEEDSGDNEDIFSFLADPSDANKVFVSSLLEEKQTDGYQEGYEDGYRAGRNYPTRSLSEWP